MAMFFHFLTFKYFLFIPSLFCTSVFVAPPTLSFLCQIVLFLYVSKYNFFSCLDRELVLSGNSFLVNVLSLLLHQKMQIMNQWMNGCSFQVGLIFHVSGCCLYLSLALYKENTGTNIKHRHKHKTSGKNKTLTTSSYPITQIIASG